jgi:hypothetical protein
LQQFFHNEDEAPNVTGQDQKALKLKEIFFKRTQKSQNIESIHQYTVLKRKNTLIEPNFYNPMYLFLFILSLHIVEFKSNTLPSLNIFNLFAKV